MFFEAVLIAQALTAAAILPRGYHQNQPEKTGVDSPKKGFVKQLGFAAAQTA
jgi:hypothetical protein